MEDCYAILIMVNGSDGPTKAAIRCWRVLRGVECADQALNWLV